LQRVDSFDNEFSVEVLGGFLLGYFQYLLDRRFIRHERS
jgi:hypothetical protein